MTKIFIYSYFGLCLYLINGHHTIISIDFMIIGTCVINYGQSVVIQYSFQNATITFVNTLLNVDPFGRKHINSDLLTSENK